jgi:hypothetical protein
MAVPATPFNDEKMYGFLAKIGCAIREKNPDYPKVHEFGFLESDLDIATRYLSENYGQKNEISSALFYTHNFIYDSVNLQEPLTGDFRKRAFQRFLEQHGI